MNDPSVVEETPACSTVVSLTSKGAAAEYLGNAFASVSDPNFHRPHPIAATSYRKAS